MHPSKNKKLIIVDDSTDIREGLKKLLNDIKSLEVVGEASDGISALATIENLHPDFVILDIKMPGNSGIITLMDIKKRFPKIVVLMLTNYPFVHYKRVCQNAGADYFFDKSNEFEEMISTIKSLTEENEISVLENS